MQGIYAIINKVNGKMYIGKSVDIETRIKRHFRELRKSIHHNKHLQRSFDFYGEDKFTWVILLECYFKNDLNEEEVSMIHEYSSYSDGYNETIGGE